MNRKINLNDYLDMIISTQSIGHQGIREELIKMIWSTMIVDIKNNYRRISGEERIFQDALKNFG